MRVRAILCVASFFILSGPVFAQEAAGPSPAAGLQLEISSRTRVVEKGGGIEVLWRIRSADKTSGMLKVNAVRDFKASGMLSLETPRAMESGFPIEFAIEAAELAAAGSRFVMPAEMKCKEGWSGDLITLSASCYVEAETGAGVAGEPKKVSGTLKSNQVEIVVKPDGWKAATYKRCAEGLEQVLRAKFQTMAFEFPEVRDLSVVTYESKPDSVTGRFKLVREYLEIDDKAKTARLRKKDGAFEFTAGDPLARASVPCDVRGYVEGGLVALDFRAAIETNKWLTERLPIVEEEIIRAIRDYGFEKAAEIVTRNMDEHGREITSTDSILRGGRPYEKEELPLIEE